MEIRSFRLKNLEMAKKIGEDLEKKVVRGNDKTLKGDYVRIEMNEYHLIIVVIQI